MADKLDTLITAAKSIVDVSDIEHAKVTVSHGKGETVTVEAQSLSTTPLGGAARDADEALATAMARAKQQAGEVCRADSSALSVRFDFTETDSLQNGVLSVACKDAKSFGGRDGK